MSNATLIKQWNEANQFLLTQLEYETTKDQAMIPKDRESAFQHLAVLYIKYIQVFRKLENIYDQIVHPQKRRILKDVVIASLARIIEIKHGLVEIEMSDISNYGDILLDLKLVPDDLKIAIPRFLREEREKVISERNKQMEVLGAKEIGAGEAPVVFPEIKISEAIKMIQIHERGRQGKLRAKYMRDIRMQAEREKDIDAGDEETDVIAAALKIQRVFRGYKDRKIARARLQEELIFLGMAPPLKESKSQQLPSAKAEANRFRRKVVQVQHEEEYQSALINTKDKIAKVEGPDMREGMQDSFRQWYMEYKRANGKFPDFPPDKYWQNPNFKFSTYVEGKELDEDEGETAGKISTPEEEKAKKGGDKKSAKGKAEEAEEDGGLKLNYDSKQLDIIRNGCNVYSSSWQAKDETENFAQKHDQEIVKNDKRKEVEAEIKAEVFEILKEELQNLKLAVDRDKKGKKGKKGKGGKGGKKGKKDKGGKGKKGKKEKDLTANRTLESLIEELIQTGILQKYPLVQLSDVKGEFDLLAQSNTKDPVVMPTIAEMQRVVAEYCVLPLGHPDPSSFPAVTKLLLFGPRGTGKTLLVNAVAAETGAYLFNLTPKNTAGQFLGKSNVTKMVHMVFKVARACPPAIVYIDNVEMIFAKKVPKDDTSDPKRLKKDLLKALKSLSGEDRVIVIGTSNKPWDGEAKAVYGAFDKILYTPKPNYPSRYTLWRDFILKKAPISSIRDLNLSILTRMSHGLSAGTIKLVCERVLTDRRLKLLRARKITTNEFIEQLLSLPPANPDEDKLFKDWYEKSPLVKKRITALTAPEEGEEVKAKDKKKK